MFPLLLVILTLVEAQKPEKEKKELLTVEVNYNDIAHTIQVGDTIHIGYGSYPHGDFMYIYNGAPPKPLGKEYARKTGTVTKVKYVKLLDQYQVHIKGKFGFYIVDIPQAIEKEEVIGFNGTMFNAKAK